MAATGLVNPQLQFFDDDGNPLNGGLLYTYVAGSSTPLDTFFASDLAPGSENTNPIVLDSAGRCVVYLSPSPAVKLILTNSEDVPVWSQDEISPVAVAV